MPGSYGLTSTLDHYMRFARMLANGGELDGVRILRPETVRLMATSWPWRADGAADTNHERRA